MGSDIKRGLPLGTPVTVAGILIGRSEFTDGPPSYLVEYERNGEQVREWFIGEDLVEEGLDQGAA